MRREMKGIRRIMVLTIIVLFFGASILPVLSGQNKIQMTLDEVNKPEFAWKKSFGLPADAHLETILSVYQNNDGGYDIFSRVFTDESIFMYMIRTDGQGNEIWDKTFLEDKYMESVEQTSDKGYILAGQDWNIDVAWLVKLDKDGEVEWEKSFDIGFDSTSFRDACETADGGYIAVGGASIEEEEYYYALCLVKTDSEGNKDWDKLLEGPTHLFGVSLLENNEGEFIINGFYIYDDNPYGSGSPVIIKTDENGEKIWETAIFEDSLPYMGNKLEKSKDGNYIILSNEFINEGDLLLNSYLIKIDDDGNQIFKKLIGQYTYSEVKIGTSLLTTDDNGFMISGFIYDEVSGERLLLMKCNVTGDIEWETTYIDEVGAFAMIRSNYGEYIMLGSEYIEPNSNIVLMKFYNSVQNNLDYLQGETSGKTGVEYEYLLSAIDSDGDNISYCIDWGDGSDEVCIGPYKSGVEVSANHTWSEKGDYSIKVKARDVYGAESDWATLEVSMPKSKAINTSLFLQKLFQLFPLFEKILNQIIL